MRITLLTIACGAGLFAAGTAGASKRALDASDFERLLSVDGVACSADWILYTVEGSDVAADERNGSVWMTGFQGGTDLRLTAAGESTSDPKFSPDGRYVSFLSERKDETKSLHLLDRRGGEAQPLDGIAGDVSEYAWSPDGVRLVISMSEGTKSGQPIVIDRLHFKEDRDGYLTAADRKQLYLFDLATNTLTPLTSHANDTAPVFSPDGRHIAFLSNRTTDEDRTGKLELDVIEARAGAAPRKLTEFFAPNKPALRWTPDGTRLLYTSGLEPRLNAYIQDRLSVFSLADGKSRLLTERLDRALMGISTASDDSVEAIVEDDGVELPVSVRLDTGETQHLATGKWSATSICSAGKHVAVVASNDSSPPEVYAVEPAGLRKLTHHNDAEMAELALGGVEDISFPSRDGTIIHGMMVKPADYHAGQPYPAILWIHGGPNGQDSHGLSIDAYSPELERQWFAAHGYVVLAVNYRGSSGRGGAFAQAIAADWGHKEVADVLGAVDYAVHEKIADPHRLGVGGWSYGGILTDYIIASDTRFKAAISGAGSGNQISMYGADEYILQYNAEMQPPWAATPLWLKVSYPFFHADRIKTPTLFLGGGKDFNVPIAGGEQMYAALRTLGVPTQLIVYPGQYHVLTRPSYIKDCMQRYLAWFDRYLGTTGR
ncbi:MAG: S9 family peptidase [Steroidobacteraceae bacterium]|jgi:dipeptidyl aminopeptidase/acylaminoacyl peptidase